MKGALVFCAVLLCAGAVFASSEVDRAPGAIPPTVSTPGDYNPVFGSIIRSFTITRTYPGGICNFADDYIITGHWGSSFTAFYVYTETGSFVRTVSGLSGNGGGFRGGSARSHFGSGYFVTAQYTGGCRRWTYSAGGNPGTSGTTFGLPAAGRGISWDGTYYYATVGTYNTPIGIYTSTGSQVGTVPGSVHTLGIYDNATKYPGNGYLYVSTQTGGYRLREVNLSTGSLVRSVAESYFNAGCDFEWDADHIWTTAQTSPGRVYCYDGPGFTGVQPTSFGKIKSVYR